MTGECCGPRETLGKASKAVYHRRMSAGTDRDAILSRRARLLALSLAGAGLSLQVGGAAPVLAAGPAASASAPSWKLTPAEEQRAARELFRRALDELHNGTPEVALDLLNQAARIHPHPKILAQIAALHERAARPDLALPLYDRILLDPDVAPELLAEIQRLADRARARVGLLRVSLGAPGSLLLDGQPVEPGEIPVLPGAHRVEVRFHDGRTLPASMVEVQPRAQLSLVLAPGPHVVPAICLSPLPPPPPPPPLQGGGCGCGSPGAPRE